MTQIPSDLSASAAQAPIQARQVQIEREAVQAGDAAAANRQVKTVDDAGTTVETLDADSRVFTDAEGSGSQGRNFSEPEGDTPQAAAPSDDGITTDENGVTHLDIKV